jgi:hypothetical protein
MPVAPSGIVHERQVAAAIQKAAQALQPEVARLRYALTLDSTGTSAIFFRVLLSDDASREDRLFETTQRFSRKMIDIVKPMEKFGMEAYFNFRSASEQAKLKDLSWE